MSEKLHFGSTYHIFNKSVGNELLFKTENDYKYFLIKIKRFILPWADVLSYCLIPNHFHLLVAIKEFEDIQNHLFKSKKDVNFPEKTLLQSFKNLFTSYSKSFNNVYNRKGRLFLEAFKKIEVNDESYLSYLICYIHRNPIHHGLVDDYAKWKFSSYNTFLSNKPTNVNRKYVLSIFGNLDEFVNFHKMNKTKKGLKEFIVE